MRRKIAYLTLFLMVSGIYIRQAAPTVTTGDSGEFMTAAFTLSIPHAPSFPLYVILGRSFNSAVPWGAPSLRGNYLSAITSGFAVLLVAMIASALGGTLSQGILLALIFGFSHSFWMNSLVTEVFSLNTLWACLMILVLLSKKDFLLTSYLLGLGLGNHHILVFFLPVLIGLFLREQGWRLPIKQIGTMILLGVIGFSVYLLLPIRSAQNPPLNWGQPTTTHKLYRTIMRKDYGSLKLAVGDTPPRTLKNCALQLKRFGQQLGREVPWPVLICSAIGLALGIGARHMPSIIFVILFGFFGPVFYLMGNLPMNALSEGIMGRFFVIPVLLLLFGLLECAKRLKRGGLLFMAVFALAVWERSVHAAEAHRRAYLVWDYSRSLLRGAPPHATLYLDGGDDAFYGLATQQYVYSRRPDVTIYDRGGLIFGNPYGADFRRLPPHLKEERRHAVEKKALRSGPVFYSSMDPNVLPGEFTRENGLLLEPGNRNPMMGWPLIILRGLYPLTINDYRTRALGAYFPYWRGRTLVNQGMVEEGIRDLWRAQKMGPDVEWLKTNLTHLYAVTAYGLMQNGQYALAQQIYRQWIDFKPEEPQPYVNLGFVFEKLGDVGAAEKIYLEAMARFPRSVDPVYNLAVLNWHKREWEKVVLYFNEVLARDPHHPEAGKFLAAAKMRMEGR